MVVEPLRLVEADHLYLIEHREQLSAEALHVGDGNRIVGLGAVRCNCVAVIPDIDVRLVADDALPGDAGALEAADEFVALA